MTWVLLILQIFGPALAEILKRLVLKWLPELPKAERSLARAEVRSAIRRSLRRDAKAAHGYAAACTGDELKADLEAIEARFSARVAALQAAAGSVAATA